MPNWANLMLTKQGKVLQAKAIAGSTLTITKMKLGSGIIPEGVSPEDLTDLIQPKQVLGLTAISVNGGLAKIQSIVTNAELSEGYYIRECGVFATDPDEGEVMYAIMTDTSPDFLPAASSSVVISEEFSINVVTENVSNITATIDPEGIVTVANARKIAEDKVTEHNKDTDAHPNDFNLKGFTIGKDSVVATKKGDLLTLLAGKGINLLSDIKNKIITIVGKSKNAWNPNEVIIAGDIRYTEDGNGPSWAYLECKTAGITGTTEPIVSASAAVGTEISDGSVVWTVQNIKGQSMLAAYPVGTIYMSVLPTSPADLFGGTWEEMPAGRVLLAQGDAEWGTTYTAGSTGGEATHQLSVGELPSHNHNVTCSIDGDHNHGITTGNNTDAPYNMVSTQARQTNTTRYTNSAGNHSHTITIAEAGSNVAHNNLQPYLAVYLWKRTT